MTGKRHLILFAALISNLAFISRQGMSENGNDSPHAAHDEHESGDEHEEESAKFGPGKAIEAVEDQGRRFKLSQKSVAAAGIKSEAIQPGKASAFIVPKAAVVYFRDETGVYAQRDDWFEMIDAQVVNVEGASATINAKGLRKGDRVVVSGVAWVRVAHLEASGQGGEGHVH